MFRTTAAALALVLVLPAFAQESPDKLYEQPALEALVKAAVPLVEAETGRKFANPVVIRTTTPAALAAILVPELAPQLKLQSPGATPEQVAAASRQMAGQLSRAMFGKFAVQEKSVLVVPENFKRMSELLKEPRILTAAYLRAVVIHELVHALDEDSHQAMTRIAGIRTEEALWVWNAVIEGHAQHIAHRILRRAGEEQHFKLLEEQILRLPPGLSEAEKFQLQVVMAPMRFAYLDGKRFFDALEQGGRKSFADVFARPPTSKTVVLNPETYDKPAPLAAAPVDLAPLWRQLGTAFPGWQTQTRVLDGLALRTGMGDLVEKQRVDEVVAALVGGQVHILTPADAPGQKVAVLGVCQMKDEAGATKCYALNEALLRAKDKRMAAGAVRITRADYGALASKKAGKNVTASKTIVTPQGELRSRSLLAYAGRFVIELNFLNVEPDDQALTGHLEKICDFLKDK